MKYNIDKTNRPVYLQLYKQLREDIIGGVYTYNEKLPSKRLLADETGVSLITVEHAYDLLCDEGYAEARMRRGYFVLFRSHDGFASTPEEVRKEPIPRMTSTESEFSLSILSKTMRRVLTDYGEAILQKSPNTGLPLLREAIRRYLARNRGIFVSVEQIVLGSGAEYLYGLIVELLGRDKTYAIESPSYDKIEKIYHAAHVRCELLPLSEDGIDSAALEKSTADVLHTTPYRSFPSGVTASATKRHEYIRWAQKNSRYIIESDYGSEFSVASQPPEPLFVLSDSDNVLYLNTFSKTVSPSLRVGYMVLPKHLVQLFFEKLGFYSCTVPTFEQYLLAELIGSGELERHINRVRRSLRRSGGEL